MCANNNCKCGSCTVSMIAHWLVLIGAINWGLVGAGMLAGVEGGWNVVHMLLSAWPVVEAIVYLLVGIAAIAKIIGCKCAKCMSGCATCKVDGNMMGDKMGADKM